MFGQRVLVIYAGALTVLLAASLFSGFLRIHTDTADEINVHRINIRESDGTLRMVISNSSRLPGVIVKGREEPKVDRPQAGMIFFNDEGTENGGLIFGGKRLPNGDVASSGGSLSFDRYGANQVVQLIGVDDKDDSMAGLAVSDSHEDGQGARRLWAGRADDGASQLALMDAAGKKRIQLKVSASGEAQIAFLDADGNVSRAIQGDAATSADTASHGKP